MPRRTGGSRTGRGSWPSRAQWAGRELLGESVGAAIVAAAPVTVRVTGPGGARRGAAWPLELAHVGGKPLAAQGDVTFVYDIAPDGAPHGARTMSAPALRVLAVFSQPTETSVLALRRERYALSQADPADRRAGAGGRWSCGWCSTG